MIVNVFPTQLYKTNLSLPAEVRASIRSHLVDLFGTIHHTNHLLEQSGGKSTHTDNRQLHTNPIFAPLVADINLHVKRYWKELYLSSHLEPEIVSMWANLHTLGAWTDLHSHARHTLVGCYYLEFPLDSGDIQFLNPLEYHTHALPFSENGKLHNTWYDAKIKENDLVLFPAYLKHKTAPSRSPLNRISINFNFDFKEKTSVEFKI